jgi:hypothetical protein
MKRSEVPTFKVWSIADNTPLTCFDFVSDAVRRVQWDDMTDEARVVETIGPDTRIVYVRAKPIWPTAGTALAADSPCQYALADCSGRTAPLLVPLCVRCASILTHAQPAMCCC